MKIRNGFVSNSSSSSFIVKLEKDIDQYSLEDFRQLLGISEFDPVARLYNDLKDKSQSKRNYAYDDEYIQLKENEYKVCYGDEYSEFEGIMEHDFMPNLDIVIEQRSHH